MTDSETLLIALIVVYLIECLFWVRPGAVVFRTLWNKHWRLAPVSQLLTNDRGALSWGNPCPPFGCVHVARFFPLCLSPLGLWVGGIEAPGLSSPPLPIGKFYPFEAIESIRAVEKKLLLNNDVVWRSDSIHQPIALKLLLRDLKQRDPAGRAARLRQELAARFDRPAIIALCEDFASRTSLLHTVALQLFFFLFAVCPLVIWRFGWWPALWVLLAALLVQTIVVTVVFRRLHKHFFPMASDDRFKLSMLALLVPAVSIRARDLLSRSLLENFHPLAIACALLTGNAFAQFARQCWRDLKYPFLPRHEPPPPEALEAEAWFRTELLAAVESFLLEQGLSDRVWLEVPKPSDPSHALFCPRCETQFTAAATECAPCGGRPLEKLSAPGARL